MTTDRWGVADGWQATDGSWQSTDPETAALIARAQGADEHPNGPPPANPVWFVTHRSAPGLSSRCALADEDGRDVGTFDALPADLATGVYDLQPLDGGPTTALFVVPERARVPRRSWGWSTQLYATRSGASWGMGDLGDLAELAEWAEGNGAELLAHNPLGAALPLDRQQPSPYYASSRRFLSPLYIDIAGVAGAESIPAQLLDSIAVAVADLNRSPLIDRDAVWRLKSAALEAIATELADTGGHRAAILAALEDRSLRSYATFCALAEHFDSGWQQWPAPYRHPDSDAVEAFALMHAERVRFHAWVQVEAERQLAHAARVGSGLMGDLPVGFDPSGFDAWVDQDLLALGCSIGAPPDDLGPLGQDWGLPPYVPWRLRNEAYRPWISTLRRLFAHSSALRIDHVMGLFRLFWIPNGLGADRGAYVYQHEAELLDLVLMVAAETNSAVVGEDLGTVEPSVREALTRRGVYGYRIGWFEDDAPETWPATTLASLTTHDLPTVAGLWNGTDAADRAAAGQPPSPVEDAELLGRLRSLAGVGPGAVADVGVVNREAHRALARSGSDLAIVTLEDAVGAERRPNVPGTVDEHPNWRLALPVPIERLDAAGAGEIAAIMRSERGGDGPGVG